MFQTCWVAGVESQQRDNLGDQEQYLEAQLSQIVFVEEPGTIFFLMMNIWGRGWRISSNNTSPANNTGQSVMKTATMDPIILHDKYWQREMVTFYNQFPAKSLCINGKITLLAVLNK